MKRTLRALLIIIVIFLISGHKISAREPKLPLIPKPQEMEWGSGWKGFYHYCIESASGFDNEEKMLGEYLQSLGATKSTSDNPQTLVIKLTSGDVENPYDYDGAYSMIVGKRVEITAPNGIGIFHGIQTFRQLIRKEGVKLKIAKCKINDWPAFKIRGYMQDVGRNYQSMEMLKEQIDVLAAYKSNIFHLHLTDNPGWRLESKIYPELQSEKASRSPNIVILYADDLGWSDLACYGNKFHQTPHLDKLASEGVRFTNAYAAAPICSASRASILTGKSPARLNFEFVSTKGHVTDKLLLPPKRTMELPLSEITFAEIAKEAGYRTAMFGKWHVSKHNGGYLKWSNTHGPLQQGFDEGSDDFGSHPYDKNNQNAVCLNEGEYPEDASANKAVQFIEQQKDNNQPFLLFFSSYYVHTPVIPNNSWLIEKYRKLIPDAKDDQIKYAAFIESMDHYFGEILNALKVNGFSENTLIVFTSDNGGHPRYTRNLPLRGNKWNLYEGGVREPFIIKWTERIKPGKVSDVPIIAWDILPTISDLLNVKIPKNIDGVSLLPLILKNKTDYLKNRVLYWHFPYYHPAISYEGTKPCSAILDKKYKLLYFYENGISELYNLENDPTEKNNLASKLPDVTRKLQKKLMRKLNNVNARFPVKNILDENTN